MVLVETCRTHARFKDLQCGDGHYFCAIVNIMERCNVLHAFSRAGEVDLIRARVCRLFSVPLLVDDGFRRCCVRDVNVEGQVVAGGKEVV